MSSNIRELSIKELLSDRNYYIIPMYQRNYAWGEGEVTQLIQDVADCQTKGKSKAKYYIGTLVVFKREDGRLEVIDGQQRFTTLSLLATYLKNLDSPSDSMPRQKADMSWFNKVNIEFESRPKSSATFAALEQKVDFHRSNSDDYNQGIVTGHDLIARVIKQLDGVSLEEFAEYLFNKVKIMCVEVPQDTDLNHYFEVMNSRGEQLEKHEILKANLISVLSDPSSTKNEEKRAANIYALEKVWEACANMESYVQYGFSPEERHKIFGENDWGTFEPSSFNDVRERLDADKQGANEISLAQIVEKVPPKSKQSLGSDANVPDRFNSVINFPNFLLHVLRVFTQDDIALDDKQLIDQFESHLLCAEKPIREVKGFIYALLKCKYLFDQFVIKREFTQGKDSWSVKRLKFYSSKSVSFVNSFDDNEGGYEGSNRKILMLLAAFHVSTPTMVYKHWLSAALNYLYHEENLESAGYANHLNNVARRFIFDRFLSKGERASYYELVFKPEDDYPKNKTIKDIELSKLCFGQIENNFVFNYLDYLLWTKGGESNVVKDFEFTFRSSTEHFYPQHPRDGHPTLKNDDLHSFGNLCLISHSKNSRLSNFSPKAKLDDLSGNISQGSIDSLKLLEMIETTKRNDGWSTGEIREHNDAMLELLIQATES